MKPLHTEKGKQFLPWSFPAFRVFLFVVVRFIRIIPIVGFKDYYKGLLAEKMEAGLKAKILSRPRVPTAALPSGTKHCNYLNSVLGAIEVTSAQTDIGIAVDREDGRFHSRLRWAAIEHRQRKQVQQGQVDVDDDGEPERQPLWW